MKIATWNVNSVRVRLEQIQKYLDYAQPDALCLQELKAQDEQFPHEAFAESGYTAAVAGQKTWNGVAILSKAKPENVEIGMGHLPDEHPYNLQRRLIAATVDGVRVISAYLPNGEALGNEKFAYKMGFFRELRSWLDQRYDPDEPLALCGDFNITADARDLHNPDELRGQTPFSPPELEALEELRAFGFTDCFRLHHEEGGRYSWWDFRGGMFWKGLGMRIDHIWATRPLTDRCTECDIDERPRRWKRPSDHTVVWANFSEEE